MQTSFLGHYWCPESAQSLADQAVKWERTKNSAGEEKPISELGSEEKAQTTRGKSWQQGERTHQPSKKCHWADFWRKKHQPDSSHFSSEFCRRQKVD